MWQEVLDGKGLHGPLRIRTYTSFMTPTKHTGEEGTGICQKHGKVMLHSGPCSECQKEIDKAMATPKIATTKKYRTK